MDSNHRQYWFRAKQHGLGWGLPLTWSGWLFFVGWFVAVPLGLLLLIPRGAPSRLAFVVVMVLLLLLVCYWKGDPAGRRWRSHGRP